MTLKEARRILNGTSARQPERATAFEVLAAWLERRTAGPPPADDADAVDMEILMDDRTRAALTSLRLEMDEDRLEQLLRLICRGILDSSREFLVSVPYREGRLSAVIWTIARSRWERVVDLPAGWRQKRRHGESQSLREVPIPGEILDQHQIHRSPDPSASAELMRARLTEYAERHLAERRRFREPARARVDFYAALLLRQRVELLFQLLTKEVAWPWQAGQRRNRGSHPFSMGVTDLIRKVVPWSASECGRSLRQDLPTIAEMWNALMQVLDTDPSVRESLRVRGLLCQCGNDLCGAGGVDPGTLTKWFERARHYCTGKSGTI